MPAPLIYHNPHCSKSRETLALLRAEGFEPTIIEYLLNPPSATELQRIATMLGRDLRGLLRRDEPAYAELDLDNPLLGAAELLRRVVGNPALIQRPIVVANGRAAIGRPPEAVLEILRS